MGLQATYRDKIRPELAKSLGKHLLAVPQVRKVVINAGIGRYAGNQQFIDFVTQELALLTGQKPQLRKARKSIASFKVREGAPSGLRVTLRGKRMYDFLDKLVNIALPRVRDFQGLAKEGFDGKGNYNLGLIEHIAFPEVIYESMDKVFGLGITIVTTAKTNEEAFALLKTLGFPFRRESGSMNQGKF